MKTTHLAAEGRVDSRPFRDAFLLPVAWIAQSAVRAPSVFTLMATTGAGLTSGAQRTLDLDQDQVRYVRRLYRLTTPRTIKTTTTNNEIRVRIPQMSVTFLLRTAFS